MPLPLQQLKVPLISTQAENAQPSRQNSRNNNASDVAVIDSRNNDASDVAVIDSGDYWQLNTGSDASNVTVPCNPINDCCSAVGNCFVSVLQCVGNSCSAVAQCIVPCAETTCQAVAYTLCCPCMVLSGD